MKDCPSREMLEQASAGTLPGPEASRVREHLQTCEVCAALYLERKPTVSLGPAVPAVPQPARDEPVAPSAPTDRSLTPLSEEEMLGTSPTLSLGKFEFLAPAQSVGEIGRLGAYRVLRVLGEGGMGLVFKGEDPMLERPVALKVMKPESAADPVARKRFLLEGKLAASVRHDHIVAIYHVDDSQGVPFLAMEFLEGEPLDRRLKREGKQPVAELLRIGREVAEGLAAAHEKGLVHRDIKPANIWMEKVSGRADRAKILDFGLARSAGDNATNLTRTGVIMGTPDYMAPEQARGQALDARCDLFSLGCVLYQMATGNKPFHGEDVMAVLLALATEEPVPIRQVNPDIPWEVEERIKALMAKNPGDRPKDARTVVEAFEYLEKNLDKLGAPRVGPAAAPERPALPGGLPRPAPRRAPRRMVNPNASIDELLGGPTRTDKPPAQPPATAAASSSKSATAPLEELSSWSGENVPVPTPAPAPRPVPPAPSRATPLPPTRSDATAPLLQPTLPANVPRVGRTPVVAPSVPLTGLCPKCGARSYGKSSLGWCQVCGFSAAAPQPTDTPLSIQERYQAEQSKSWLWTVLLGSVVIIGASLGAAQFVPRGSTAWKAWVWMQFSSGLGSFLFAYVWAYMLVRAYHDSSQTFLPMYCTPLRFAYLAFRRSYYTKNAICLGGWGLALTIGIALVVGDASFFWKKDKMSIPTPLLEKRVALKRVEASKGQRTKCLVIGYQQEGPEITGVVLAEMRDGKLQNRGLVDQMADTPTSTIVPQALSGYSRSSPVIPVPNVTAQWVEPHLGCTVEFERRESDGRLVAPIIVHWERR